MLHGKTVAVVVPAYNEETQIGQVLATMPAFVDRIVVVNDCSRDATEAVVREFMRQDREGTACHEALCENLEETRYNRAEVIVRQIEQQELQFFTPSEVVNDAPDTDRVILINLLRNGGVGAAIARGYKWCKDYAIDCTAVMAGDGQMDPSELESICLPVVDEGIDYVKGNRLIHRSAWLVIPKIRYFGNSILSMLTKIASGYWRVSDTQTGYTAISLAALRALRLYKIYPRYGMPNDMLVKLNIAYCTLREVEIKPVYNVGEVSKMNIRKVICTVSWLLCKCFFKRLWIKYLFKDFHPIFMLYNLSFFTLSVAGLLSLRLLGDFLSGQSWSFVVLLLFVFLSMSGFQFLLSAMWMDMQDNDRLYK